MRRRAELSIVVGSVNRPCSCERKNSAWAESVSLSHTGSWCGQHLPPTAGANQRVRRHSSQGWGHLLYSSFWSWNFINNGMRSSSKKPGSFFFFKRTILKFLAKETQLARHCFNASDQIRHCILERALAVLILVSRTAYLEWPGIEWCWVLIRLLFLSVL